MTENLNSGANDRKKTVIDMIRRHQQKILEEGGQTYLDKATRATNVIGTWYADHDFGSIETLRELQVLKPEQIAAVMSSLEAVDFVEKEAMKDSQLAKKVLYKCLDRKNRRILEEMLGRPIGPENATRALSYIDLYRLADAYLKQTYLLSLGSAVHSVKRAWEKA